MQLDAMEDLSKLRLESAGALLVSARLLIFFIFFPLLFCGCKQQRQPDETCSPVFQQPALKQEGSEPQQQVSFLFFSDTQAEPGTGDYSSFGELVALALARGVDPDLVIFGGDTVNDGGDADEWQNFWEAATRLSSLTTAAVAGNHDNYPLLPEQFDYPANAPANQGEGYFYSFSRSPVHVIMLDSNIMGAANEKDIEWLRADLESVAALQAAWRIVVMHHPMWPVAENPKDAARAETMRESFLPLLEEGGADLILCGHQHTYARSLPMSGDSAALDGRKGIAQIMAASGGKQSYAAGDWEYVSVSADAPNYLYVTASDDELTVTAYDKNGKPFDTCTITR